MVHHLTQGVAMLTKEVDVEAEELMGYDTHVHADVKQFAQHDLEGPCCICGSADDPNLGSACP